jgi:hypothetical protein
VDPHLNQIVGLFNNLGLGNEKTLENVGQVTHIELVVEVNGSLSEVLLNFTVEGQGSLDDGNDLLLNGTLELGEVLAHESIVDGEQRGLLGERNSKGPEVTLKTRVDLERTSSWVHASCVKGVLDVLQGQLGAIIPVIVIFVLSQKRDSSLSVVGIKSGHVQVINEIDELEFTDGGISTTSLLFELLLEDILEKHRISVEVEVNNLHNLLISGSGELV